MPLPSDTSLPEARRPRSGPQSRRRSNLGWLALAAAVYLVLTLIYLRPIWRLAGSHLAPDPGDPVFNLDVLKWGIHQARLGFPDFWNAPFFYPTRGVITLSDHLLGPALAAASFRAVVPNPVAAYNLIFAASFILCGLSVFYVLRRSGLAPLPALLGGTIFAFSPYRWDQLSHLQMLLAGLVPLVLWSWDRLLAAPSWRRAAGFVALYALHLSGGNYLAYMIHVPLAVLLLNRLAAPGGRALLGRRGMRVLLPAVALCAGLSAALFWPYVRVARELGLERSGNEVRRFGASLASFVTPSERNLYAGLFPDALRRHENSLFAGFLPTALAALALAAALGRHRSRRSEAWAPLAPRQRWALGGLLAAAALGYALGERATWMERGSYHLPFVLFAGGLLGWLLLRRRWGGWPWRLGEMDVWWRGLLLSALACILLAHPLVYTVLMRVVPGMKGMRVPARFYVFVSFALACAAARGFAELRARLSTPLARRAFGALVAAALLIELAPRPLPWISIEPESRFPPVYRWLAGRGDLRAYVELPFGDDPSAEATAVYHDSLAWRPLVNGYSGYLPPAYLALRDAGCFPLPEGKALDLLHGWGVTHVLLHTAALDRRWERRFVRQWESAGKGIVVYDDGADRVYRLLAPVRDANRSGVAPLSRGRLPGRGRGRAESRAAARRDQAEPPAAGV